MEYFEIGSVNKVLKTGSEQWQREKKTDWDCNNAKQKDHLEDNWVWHRHRSTIRADGES